MARPDDQSPNRHLPGIRGKLFLARAVLAWEALWPALWPAVGIAGLFLSLALLDFLPDDKCWQSYKTLSVNRCLSEKLAIVGTHILLNCDGNLLAIR